MCKTTYFLWGYQIVIAIREEVLDLEKAGIRMIQIDEAALKEKLPIRKSDWYSEYLDWKIHQFSMQAAFLCYPLFPFYFPFIFLLFSFHSPHNPFHYQNPNTPNSITQNILHIKRRTNQYPKKSIVFQSQKFHNLNIL